MKKITLVLFAVLTTVSLSAFSYIKWGHNINSNEVSTCKKAINSDRDQSSTFPETKKKDIALAIGSRFNSTISKEALKNAKVISDFMTCKHSSNIVSYKSLTVNVIDDNGKAIKSVTGDSDELNAEQIELLQSIDYSTNIMLRADFVEKNKESGELEDGYTTPHLTIVPETQASYADGWDEIIFYLRANTKAEAAMVIEENLEPGKLYFTIAKDGAVSDVYIGSSSGYSILDTKMLELINNMPAHWTPATNANGEPVEQILVVSFGNIGC